MIKKITHFFIVFDIKLARLLFSLACKMNADEVLVSATREMKKQGYIPFQVQTVAGVEYVRCQNTRAWRRVGK